MEREAILVILVIVFILFLTYMVARIAKRSRKGPKVKKIKKTKVLEAIESTSDSDSIFNSIISTKRIASNLKRRGINTSQAQSLINKAESNYEQGKEERAKLQIEEAKELLLDLRRGWDRKTGFGVVPGAQTEKTHSTFRETVDLTTEGNVGETEPLRPIGESPDSMKTMGKKPNNYLPSKFTISTAEAAIENARNKDADVQEAQRLLVEAKACFAREDYNEAFKYALDSKRNAEMLLGVSTEGEGGEKKAISDLATLPLEKEEEEKTCSICGEKKIPYICIEVKDGEEATCKECYEKTMKEAMDTTPQEPAQPQEAVEEEMEEETHYCPNCGAKVMGEDVFCGKCGKPVKEELKCVGCGMKVEPGDMFCRKCGARLVT